MNEWMDKLVVDCGVYHARLTANACATNQLVAEAAAMLLKRHGVGALTGFELDRLTACNGCKKTQRSKWKIQGLIEMLREEFEKVADMIERADWETDYEDWDRIRALTAARVHRFKQQRFRTCKQK